MSDTHDSTGTFHDDVGHSEATPSIRSVSDAPGDALIGQTIGHYKIRRVIASGGMGTVYEAVQESPRRTVAIKVMKQGIASRSALRRFEYESQILARLRHPGIAQVYESGTHDVGEGAVPYFAMEYIPNAKPITEYAKAKKLITRERLELFAKVCDAVHHGHQRGIIHRDLKPGNILVDSHGQPKVIDFGVARATDSDMAVTTLQTDVGQLIGTLQYMSPEQCDADPHDLDTRSDVYALGVVLYELLCEQLPYDVTKVAVYEAARVIRETQPARLSSFSRRLRGDVETVALKALEKERDRRYSSAADLGADIGRYLKNEPIAARPPSIIYQFRTFARRNKPVVIGTAAVFLVLLVGLVGMSVLYAQALEAQRDAEEARAAAVSAIEAEAEQRRIAEQQQRFAEARAEVIDWNSYVANVEMAASALDSERFDRVRERLDACPEHLRNWEWYWLNASADSSLLALTWHTGPVDSAAFSPDGTRIVAASEDGTARVLDATSGDKIAELKGHAGSVWSAVFNLNGTRIVTASADGTARVWDAMSGENLAELRGHRGWVNSAAFSPDGTRIVTASADGIARVWDAKSGEKLTELVGHRGWVNSAAFSPDGTQIATASNDHTARVWDAISGNSVDEIKGHTLWVLCAAWDREGTRLVTASLDGTVRVWDAIKAPREGAAKLGGHSFGVNSAAFIPSGTRIVTASADGIARVWDAMSGEKLTELVGHRGWVNSAAFSPDGTQIATASNDHNARIWDAMSGENLAELVGHTGSVNSAAFSPDGTRIVTASRDATARLWDIVPYGIRYTERQINARGGDGSTVVRTWLEEAGWIPMQSTLTQTR